MRFGCEAVHEERAVLTYTKTPDSNVAEIVVDGKISDEEMNAAIAAMKADLDRATA